MITPSNLIMIKWISGNIITIELKRDNTRLYLTRKEALDLIEAVNMFKEAYPEDFTEDKLNLEDVKNGDEWDIFQ